MFYLLWAILNLFVLYKASRYLGKKLGVLWAIFILMFLYSFSAHNTQQSDQKRSQWTNSLFREQINGPVFSQLFVIKNNLLFKVKLSITYKKTPSGDIQLLSAYTQEEGIFCGYGWKTEFLSIASTDVPGKFSYELNRQVKGTILGIQIFVDGKDLQGVVSISNQSL